MNLTDLFDLSFKDRRNRTALEFEGQALTFGEIDDRSNRMAHLFAARGLRAGDRLCVYLANCLEMIDVYLACIKLGVIFVPINILYREREIAHILADAEPKAAVALGDSPGFSDIWRSDELSRAAAVFPASRPIVTLDGEAPAAIVYTSGTTGASKGAMLTHNNFLANAVNLIACWKISEADRFLLPLPLFHIHGLGNGLHTWLIAGCRMRLLGRFERETATMTFLDFRPTLFFGVPTIYVRLLETAPDAAREIGSFMRLFVSGSAPLPAQVLGEFRGLFGHAILERYGMTETFMNLSNPYTGERRPGTVGLPLPGVSVKLIDGELYVRGPNVFSGYWKREDATRQAFVDGYFRTGDLAVRSEDGYYTLQGRKSDLIISSGFNVYPREIEEFLEEQPGITEAAVAAEPDRTRGEVPVAYVVTTDDFDCAAVEAVCRAKLASFKVPRRFVRVDRLPRTALGKIQKRLLGAVTE
jgi:malonyl-CoA/methylmalonyl-CoA synthetase